MSWAAVAVSAISAGVGIYQTQQGKKLAEQAGDRPDYEIPESARRALGTSQLQSLKGMPGAVKSQMLQEMDRSRMASLRQVQERRGGLGVVSQLEQNQQDAIRQMGIMDIQQREKNIQGLQDMRMKMAGYEEKQGQDELASWEQQSQAAAAMKGAGMQNIMGGVTGLATSVAGKMDTAASLATGGGGGTSGPQFKTTIGGENNQMIGGTGYTGGALNSQNYSFNQGTGQFNFNQPTSPFATGGGFPQNQQKINTSILSKNMGFGSGLGTNENMFSNVGLASQLNTYEQGNTPSLQNQSFGANQSNFSLYPQSFGQLGTTWNPITNRYE
tara:strand:- start:1219 stop:2202 length:984 start_codon:yes stop_codon:yes gene_type:complete